MTLEMAAQIVAAIADQDTKIEAFCHFVDYLRIDTHDERIMNMFASMSGFLTATLAEKWEE